MNPKLVKLSKTVAVLGGLAFLLPAAAGHCDTLSLTQALQLAIRHSPALAGAQADAAGARADAHLANAAANPYVSANVSYTYLNPPTVFGGQEVFRRTTQTESAGLHLSLWDPTITANRRAARLAVGARDQAFNATQQEVLLQVTRSYWSVAAAREQLAAAEDAAAFLDDNAKKVQITVEAGAATKGDLLRAQAEAAVANDHLLSAENGVKVALSALKLSIGLDQTSAIDVPETALHPDGSVLTLAEGKSPSVLAAQDAYRAAVAQVDAARGGRDPKVSLDASVLGIPQGADFPRRDGSVSASVNLTMPIFDGGVTAAQVAKARAGADKAASGVKAAKDQLAFQQTSTELQLTSARARWQATEQQVASAIESRRLTEVGYREGVNTQTDVLSAQSAVSMAQASRIQSLVDVKIAEAERLAAISRLDVLLNGER